MIVGSSMREGATVPTHNNTKGLVRAFDVRTGKLLWTFNTIPRPGEFGNDTWENDSWADQRQHRRVDADHRRRGARPRLSAGRNADRRLLRRPSPRQQPVRREPRLRRSEDRRSASGTSSSCTIRSGTSTSRRRRSCSTSPSTASAIKAVASPSKQACLYVFDRVTGQPVWPIEERPVPQSDVPGEKTSPTQPFPTKPPAYARNYLKVPDDLIDFTPELRAQALERAEALQVRAVAVHAADPRQRQRHRSRRVGRGDRDQLAGLRPPIRRPHVVYAQAGNMASARDRWSRRRRASPTSATCRASAGEPFRVVLGPGDCCAADAPHAARGPRAGGAAPPAAAAGGAGRRRRRV